MFQSVTTQVGSTTIRSLPIVSSLCRICTSLCRIRRGRCSWLMALLTLVAISGGCRGFCHLCPTHSGLGTGSFCHSAAIGELNGYHRNPGHRYRAATDSTTFPSQHHAAIDLELMRIDVSWELSQTGTSLAKTEIRSTGEQGEAEQGEAGEADSHRDRGTPAAQATDQPRTAMRIEPTAFDFSREFRSESHWHDDSPPEAPIAERSDRAMASEDSGDDQPAEGSSQTDRPNSVLPPLSLPFIFDRSRSSANQASEDRPSETPSPSTSEADEPGSPIATTAPVDPETSDDEQKQTGDDDESLTWRTAQPIRLSQNLDPGVENRQFETEWLWWQQRVAIEFSTFHGGIRLLAFPLNPEPTQSSTAHFRLLPKTAVRDADN